VCERENGFWNGFLGSTTPMYTPIVSHELITCSCRTLAPSGNQGRAVRVSKPHHKLDEASSIAEAVCFRKLAGELEAEFNSGGYE
jgi:hypothetical protein